MASSKSWQKIFDDYAIGNHDFSKDPFYLSAEQIKRSCQDFTKVAEKEVRILCKQDTREQRPKVLADRGLFLLPVKNGEYAIVEGEGYVDIPEITSTPIEYGSKLNFHLDTAVVGDSEMQHLDMAYASSIIRTFLDDPSLVLTIRGRKRTPASGFNFHIGGQFLEVQSVQTEVDAGYEGESQVALFEAKKAGTHNTIIRQMFYPLRQWKQSTEKTVSTLFFERNLRQDTYNIWQFGFHDEQDYNSVYLIRSERYLLTHKTFEEKQSVDGS